MTTPDDGSGITHGAGGSVRYAAPAKILAQRIPPFRPAGSARRFVSRESGPGRIRPHPVSMTIRRGASPRCPR